MTQSAMLPEVTGFADFRQLMFEHRDVGLRRHLMAIAAAALANGAATAVIGVLAMALTGKLDKPLYVVVGPITTVLLVLAVAVFMAPVLAAFFSLLRWLLQRLGRNIGWPYLLLGTLICMTIGAITAGPSGKPLATELVGGLALGVASGLTYWRLATAGHGKPTQPISEVFG